MGCLAFVNTSVSAQNFVRNATQCEFTVKVAYGNPVTCAVAGYSVAVVAPFTQVNVAVPAGTQILYGKGTYSPIIPLCAFYIGLPCSPYPPVDNVSCTQLCGNYTAEMIPGFGIWIHY